MILAFLQHKVLPAVLLLASLLSLLAFFEIVTVSAEEFIQRHNPILTVLILALGYLSLMEFLRAINYSGPWGKYLWFTAVLLIVVYSTIA